MQPFLLFCLIAGIAAAQIVSVGVKGGIPLTQAVTGDYQSSTNMLAGIVTAGAGVSEVTGNYPSPTNMLDTGRWTIGPTIEFRLPFRFSLEADLLYRAYREQFSGSEAEVTFNGTTYPATFLSSQSNNKVWDLPLLLKYRILPGRFRPFVDAGYTLSHRTSDVNSVFECLSSAAVCSASTFSFHNSGQSSFSQDTAGPTGGIGIEYKYAKLTFAPEMRFTRLSNPTANVLTLLLGVTF
jgi:hypothetical protein